jgi:hypothetical protein
MERTLTRSDLSSAVIHILEVKGVANPRDAVEVLGSPGNGVRLFLIIPSERAKLALAEELMRVTGHRHPTAGEVWILDEAQGLALIDMDGKPSAAGSISR